MIKGFSNRMKTFKYSTRRWLAGGAFLLLSLPSLGWSQTVDLVANNSGPSTSAAGQQFTYVLKLSNNGPYGADGTTFSDTIPAGAIDVSATCTGVRGNAVCPTGADLSVSNTIISGTLPTFPDQGLVEITVTGTYGIGSPTSVSSTATLTPPSGVTETNDITNTSTVNTTLITDAKLIVNKTQTSSGTGEVTYTINVKNEGNAAAHGAKLSDYLYSSSATSSASAAILDVQFVSCSSDGNAECPQTSDFHSFSGLKGTTNRYLFQNAVIPKLPAGGSLTIIYTAAITPETSVCGLTQSSLNNYATIFTPTGITNVTGTPTSSALVTVPGTAACPAAPPVGTVTKTQTYQDGTPIPPNTELPFGTHVRYTITAVNTSGVDASGATIRDYTSYSSASSTAYLSKIDANFISCAADGSAQCPTDFPPTISRGGSGGNSGNLFNVAIPQFPAGGKITVVYDAVFSPPSFCGIASGSFYNYAQLTPAAGSTGMSTSGLGSAYVRTPATDPCADVTVTKTQSTDKPQPGVPVEYVVTVTNNGPGSADGTLWYDSLAANSGLAIDFGGKVEFVSCEASNNAQCPDDTVFVSRNSLSGFLMPSTTAIPKLPANGVVTLRYRMTLNELSGTQCRAASGAITNTAYVKAPGAYSFKQAGVSLPINCADVGISKTVDPIFIKPGDEVTYTVTVSNSGLSPAAGVVFSDPLPSYFEYTGGATCEVVKPSVTGAATACGSSVDYDPATRTLSSTIANVGMLGEVKFTFKGKAGVEPGTHKNIAHALLPGGLFDPIMVTNVTDVNVQLQNTSSPIQVTKQVTGLPTSGLPVDTTFTGIVTCGAQPPQNWSVTVPAGSSSGTSAKLTFYDTEICTVTEDTPPTPPKGYEWNGTPIIANSADPLGPSTPRNVSVTNALKRQTTDLTLTKLFDGPADPLTKIDGDFKFAINCGADGNFDAVVNVVGGASSRATVSDLPTGAICTVTETDKAAAPVGFVWGEPTYDTNPLTIPDVGKTATLQVTNVLKSGTTKPVPGLGGMALGALSGLMALSAFRRRRKMQA